MSKAQKTRSTFTFGNILLTLLVIGTFAVSALIFILYKELTKTPEITANLHQEQHKTQIEIMSPDAKAGDKPVYRDTAADNTAQTVAAPSNKPNAAQSADSMLTEEGLTAGAAPKKSTTKKAETKPTDMTDAHHSLSGEVPLKPINSRDNNVRQNQTSPQHADIVTERPLKPRNPDKSRNHNAIDELF